MVFFLRPVVTVCVYAKTLEAVETVRLIQRWNLRPPVWAFSWASCREN